MKELGMYIHIPFCKKKCLYCDFISFTNKEDNYHSYVQAVIEEIKKRTSKIQQEITTIYMGGGTPSLIDAKDMVEIVETIKATGKVSKEAEITIEVNPGTVTKDKLEQYVACGINRISIGLQATQDRLLQQIGRIHTYEQFLQTYHLARQVGFSNINVDVMLALPNQTLEMLQESVEKVLELQPEHISIYSLILEEETPLMIAYQQKEITLPEEEIERLMYWNIKQMLEQAGYIHYEISNFSKKGKVSRHNMNCWNQEEYIGIGVAAHSYQNNIRFSNPSNIATYLKNIQEKQIEKNWQIQEEQTMLDKQKEFMLLGLRKIEGVSITEFKKRFVQNPIYLFRKELDTLVSKGLIEVDLEQIHLTNKGLDFANMVWEEFV